MTASETPAQPPTSSAAPTHSTTDGLRTRTRLSPLGGESAEARLPVGYLLQNRYRIVEVLGIGGMSVVYKAQDMRFPSVTRHCVVKEMRSSTPDPQLRAQMIQNFEREANILATLSHPMIVQVYDYFSEGNNSYLVLEYVDGQDLEQIIEETEGFLPETQVVQWAIQICEVLSFLHNHKPQPIVFRDLKPSNIMLDSHGRIRLVDFGIARVFQSGQRGTMVGTEGYSPPEQYRGNIEPRADIYALGATLHHLLSKQDPRLEPPFSFHNRPIHRTNPFVSRDLVEIVERALEYDINKRFGSAEEMARALLRLEAARGLGPGAVHAPTFVRSDVLPIWRFACEDELRSSPAIYRGKLFIGCYDHNLYALDLERGKFLWKYATDGSIASSPCAYEGRVFVGSADRTLYAINADSGRIAWTCPTRGSIWSSPRVAFGHVFFGSDDHHFYAVNVQSGRVAWAFQAEDRVRSSAAFGPEHIYIGCEAGVVYELDTSGKSHWRFRAQRGVTSSPALGEEMVYVGSHDRHVYGLDLRSGWSVWRYRTGGPVVSSPLVEGGLVFIGSTDNFVYAFDAEDGHLVWRFETEGQVTSSPAAAEGGLYIGSVDGAIYCLDCRTGELRWRFQTGGPVTSSPRVGPGVVYIGSHDHYVYALPL